MQCVPWARQLLGDFAHNRAFEADNESLISGCRKMGPGAETCKPAVVEHMPTRRRRTCRWRVKRKGQDSFREKLKHLYPDGRNRRKNERPYAECSQRVVGRCEHLQKQKVFPGGYNAVEWSSKSRAFSSLGATIGRSVSRLCTKLKAGRQTS